MFPETSYGIGEAYLRSSDPTDNLTLWNELLARCAKWKFNTVRLAFTFPGITPNSNGSTSPTLDIDRLNDVLNLLNATGYKAVLDFHNYNVESNHDCVGWFGSPAWYSDWLALVALMKDNPTVCAYELFNEPYRNEDVTLTTWYDNNWTIDEAWNQYKILTEQIRLIDPAKPIVWGASLSAPADIQGIADFMVQNNVVRASHPWSNPTITTIEEANANVADRIAVMKTVKDAGVQCWNGEFGVHYTTVTTPDDRYEIEKYYATNLINTCLANGFGFNWWLYSKNHWRVGSADEVIGASNYLKNPMLPIVLLAVIGLGYVIYKTF